MKSTNETDQNIAEDQEQKTAAEDQEQKIISRRLFMGTAALAGAGLAASNALAQSRQEALAGREGDNASDPGPENIPLKNENPDAFTPPFTDKGNPPPIWYSFDVTAKRLEGGGWTHQVTERELPQSKDLAGVNMRLTAGSFRELHWHLADEWSIMLAGKARVTVMQPDGKMFVDDIQKGDLWYFPAGLPHSIQGLEGEGCEFLLVFDQGDFSEDDTFLLSEFLAHTPPEVVQKNMGWNRQQWDQLPATELYIFNAPLPGRRRGPHHRLQELPGLATHCDGSGDPQAGRHSGDALAPQCERVAILDQGQRPHDGCAYWRQGPYHGLQSQRCWVRTGDGRTLH